MSAAIRRHAWLAAATVVSLAITVQPFRDSDVWWHLAMGQYILAHGIPAQEPFSFVHAANPWVGQQWLYEVLLARLVGLGGPGLASLTMGAVASGALATAVLAVPAEHRPAGPWQAAALLLSALVAGQLLGVRGQVFTLLGAAVMLQVVMRWRAGSARCLWLVPPLWALWANLHAGFVVGLVTGLVALLATRRAGSRGRRQLAVALLAGLVATLVNPAGPHLWAYVAQTFSNPTLTSAVTEWLSPDFHNMWLRLFEAEAVLLVLAWLLAGGPELVEGALAGIALAASLQAQRNVSLFALVAAPQLARYGARAWSLHRGRLMRTPERRWRPQPTWLAAAGIAAVTAVITAGISPSLTTASAASFEATHEPKAAATYAGTHLAGRRIFSVDTWSGYLAYRFPSGRVVSLYDETAVFGEVALQHYLSIDSLQPGWPARVRGAAFENAIVPADGHLASALLSLRWTVDCRDSASNSVVMSAPQAGVGASATAALQTAPLCG